jgi:hypothetical protein
MAGVVVGGTRLTPGPSGRSRNFNSFVRKGDAVAFDDLTDNQKNLISRIVEELASGNYSQEVWSIAVIGRGWYLTLHGIGGAQDKEIDGFQETDLHTLNSEGYITLIPKKYGYAIGLRPKAYQQYKLSKQSETSAESSQQPAAEAGKAVSVTTFDGTQLEQIAATSKDLLEELRQNYSLSRSQSAIWFRWTLGVSIFGFILLAIGITLIFAQQATPAVVNSVAGILTEFMALVFFKQASAANQRQDQYHRDLLRRQQILDAVQLARLISQENDRNKITEMIIQSLLGIDQKSVEVATTS